VGKFIVDTSVWIDFFRGTLSQILSSNLVIGLENRQIVLTDIIFHELLMGTTSRKEFLTLKELLSPLKQLRIQEIQLNAFNDFAWRAHRKGVPGKYTDLTIAFLSHTHQFPILSFDKYFNKLAAKKIIRVISF